MQRIGIHKKELATSKSIQMRNLLLSFTIVLLCQSAISQVRWHPDAAKRYSLTVGILQGGGSLLGVDLETLLSDRIGFQVGAGLIGFGGGINYHLKPSIRSSFLSLQYWHQGIENSYTQSLFGPNFVFRSPKWFTFQIGIGFLIEEGPAWPESTEHVPVMLTYAIGAYFPL